ncbi:hypothetical protein [Streptomyces sp. YIM S03343]
MPFRPKPLRRLLLPVATMLLAGACSTGSMDSADRPGRADDTPRVLTVPARLTHALPDDPVRMVLPATGAETRWTQGLDALGRQVAQVTAADCARRQGVTLPALPPVTFIRFFAIPDLDFISRHGLSASAPVPAPIGPATANPTRGMTSPAKGMASPSTGSASPATGKYGSDTPARTADAATTRRCEQEGSAALSDLRDTYASLQRAWFTALAAVRRDPATARAYAGFPGCLARHGYRADDELSFMGLADRSEQQADAADVPQIQAALGRAYADCMRPVEAARTPARLRLRTRFLAEHTAEVNELRRALYPALRRAERENGVRPAFPAP